MGRDSLGTSLIVVLLAAGFVAYKDPKILSTLWAKWGRTTTSTRPTGALENALWPSLFGEDPKYLANRLGLHLLEYVPEEANATGFGVFTPSMPKRFKTAPKYLFATDGSLHEANGDPTVRDELAHPDQPKPFLGQGHSLLTTSVSTIPRLRLLIYGIKEQSAVQWIPSQRQTRLQELPPCLSQLQADLNRFDTYEAFSAQGSPGVFLVAKWSDTPATPGAPAIAHTVTAWSIPQGTCTLLSHDRAENADTGWTSRAVGLLKIRDKTEIESWEVISQTQIQRGVHRYLLAPIDDKGSIDPALALTSKEVQMDAASLAKTQQALQRMLERKRARTEYDGLMRHGRPTDQAVLKRLASDFSIFTYFEPDPGRSHVSFASSEKSISNGSVVRLKSTELEAMRQGFVSLGAASALSFPAPGNEIFEIQLDAGEGYGKVVTFCESTLPDSLCTPDNALKLNGYTPAVCQKAGTDPLACQSAARDAAILACKTKLRTTLEATALFTPLRILALDPPTSETARNINNKPCPRYFVVDAVDLTGQGDRFVIMGDNSPGQHALRWFHIQATSATLIHTDYRDDEWETTTH